MKILLQCCAFCLVISCNFLFAKENADVIVAQDGSGDFITIQEAINTAPVNAKEYFVIFIKNGVYNEKLFIEKNFIALVGEDRDSTIIVTAELRDIWRQSHADDWGVATINIQNGVTDLVFANLTAKNNFADVYPDNPDKNGHTMTIRGGGNRIIIIWTYGYNFWINYDLFIKD